MTLRDTVAQALGGVARAPLRAVLTGAGVAVAITVLVLMVGFGAGIEGVVKGLIETEDTLTTIKAFSRHDPRWSRAPTRDTGDDDETATDAGIDDQAVTRFAAIPGVRYAHRDVSLLGLLRRADGKERKARTRFDRFTQVIGLWPQGLPADAAARLASGTIPAADDAMGVVLSHEAARLLEDEDKATLLGSEIVLELAAPPGGGPDAPPIEVRFRVAGVLKNRQRLTDLLSTFGAAGIGARRTLYLAAPAADALAPRSLRGFTDLFRGDPETALPPGASTSATVRLVNPLSADRVRGEIERAGFRCLYAGDVLSRVRIIFGLADGVLAGLGTVALLVASLGIVNTLLMAVLERTREIGIWKALGARDREVAWGFMAEAAVLGVAGGAVGCLVGLGLGEAAAAIVNARYIVPEAGAEAAMDLFAMPWWLWGGALGLAVAVSLVAGVYPAWRAARVDPVRALRYE